jgi:hypothetical protein
MNVAIVTVNAMTQGFTAVRFTRCAGFWLAVFGGAALGKTAVAIAALQCSNEKRPNGLFLHQIQRGGFSVHDLFRGR